MLRREGRLVQKGNKCSGIRALHARKVGLILLLKGLIENPKAMNECKSNV